MQTPWFVAVLTAVIVTALLTPLARRFAGHVGAMDAPGGRRVHTITTPRMGGMAVIAGYLAGLAAVVILFPTWLPANKVVAVGMFLVGGVYIAVVGALDDVRSIGAKRKLAAQICAALIAWVGGARIESLDVPMLGPIEFGGVLAMLLTVAWILAFINAINLIDGLDGLAGGVVFFAAVTNTIVAVISGNDLAAVLNMALGGAVLGFLYYNFNPARIFLGDTGSMFLGYVLGAAALLSGRQKESTLISLLVPVIALGVPLADTLFTMVRRYLGNRSMFSADRGHIHHRLLDLGFTHQRAVLLLYACTVMMCVAALGAAFGKDWQVGWALVAAVITLGGMARFAGYFEIALLRSQDRAHLLSAPTEALRRGIPDLIVTLDEATSRKQVWDALETMLASGWFAYAEYLSAPDASPSWRWEPSQAGAGREAQLVESQFSVRCPTPADESFLRFGCLSDEPALPSHVEVLLQLAADAVERALVRFPVEHTEKPGPVGDSPGSDAEGLVEVKRLANDSSF